MIKKKTHTDYINFFETACKSQICIAANEADDFVWEIPLFLN